MESTRYSNRGVNTEISLPRRGWMLYDFANSLVVMGGSIYLPQWFVVDRNLPSVAFNAVLISTSIILFMMAPMLGRRMDRSRGIFRWLCILTLAFFVITITFGLMCKIANGAASSSLMSYLCLVLYGFVILSYQLTLVPYNALISSTQMCKTPNQISGTGYSLGWIGGVIGVFMADPMVHGKVMFSQAARDNAVLPLGVLAAALCALSLYWMRPFASMIDPIERKNDESIWSIIGQNKAILWFLISFMLVADTVLTLENNITIYMEKVHGLGDSVKAALFVAFLMCAAFSVLWQRPVQNKESLVSFLRIWILLWIAIITSVAASSSTQWFYTAFLVMGALYGLTLNACRVLFAEIIPDGHKASCFGVYSSFERFATLVGPLLWALPLAVVGDIKPGYQLAMTFLVLPMLVALLGIHKLQSSQRTVDIG